MKRTALRKVSKQKAKELALYRKMKSAILCDAPFCEMPLTDSFTCMNRATDIHHIRGRQGELLNDTRYWMTMCREHHQWIHDNAREARKRGLLK